MKPTILDLLIITCLSAADKAISLPFKLFDTYSVFVKTSPLFIRTRQGNNIIITAQNWADFRKKRSQWMSLYNRDRVVPFEGNGFGADRIASLSSTATKLLFSNEKLIWDLAQHRCYVQSQLQRGNGLCVAWDWFAISRILDRIRSIGWNIFLPTLTARSSSSVTLSFNYCPTASMPVLECKQQAYLALKARASWSVRCGPLKMVSRSQYATIKGNPLKLAELQQRMLWACVNAGDQGLTFAAAFRAVYGRRQYKPNNYLTSNIQRVPGQWTKDLKITALENTRFRLQKALNKATPSSIKGRLFISTKGNRIKLIYQ